jgi:hypothetical protein
MLPEAGFGEVAAFDERGESYQAGSRRLVMRARRD